jgi:Lanthionine-containing peptide SapB precursor RamS
MALLDLQGMEMELPAGGHAGSTLTVATCGSGKPSCLSVAICH